jgi:hypothetical protein
LEEERALGKSFIPVSKIVFCHPTREVLRVNVSVSAGLTWWVLWSMLHKV